MERERPSGVTVQVQVGDITVAREFYGAIFAGPPDLVPHENFLEWRIGNGETWFQAISNGETPEPLPGRIRFRVEQLAPAREATLAAGIEISGTLTVPGIIDYIDFTDPWGNCLGYYQELR